MPKRPVTDPAEIRALLDENARQCLEPAWEKAGLEPTYPASPEQVAALLATAGIEATPETVATWGTAFPATAIINLALPPHLVRVLKPFEP